MRPGLLLLCFLAYYVSEPYVDMLLRLAVNLKAQGYYAQMAAAWMVF